MPAISLERSGFAPTVIASLVTFAALSLLGLVLAYWTWVWLAPRPELRAQAAVQTEGRAEAAYGLFGSVARDGKSGNGATSTGFAVRLLGVVATSGSRSGHAVIRLDDKKTVAVREGGEIEPGVRLAEVHADHVVLERSGMRETLTWPTQGKAAVSTAPRSNY